MTLQKDFFGLFSGGLTLGYDQKRWRLAGSVSLDKGQLKSNVLSSQVQHNLWRSGANDVDLDVHLTTHYPIAVKSSMLQTQAHIATRVTGTIAQPKLAGVIDLQQGSFAFPYKPLYITSGKLFLHEHEPDDFAVELVAKNTLKKYTITMRVTGSLHYPKISFESSPSLPEENILMLLLSGSEEGPLYLAVPGILMMQLEGLLFGSDDTLSKAQQFFQKLLKPLKNVRIIPTLRDQEGKGLQGGIEIDINDRLRAKAHSNLSATEDTQFEVEYALSDDMSLKAVRDEKGSIGGEIEMKWKF